MPPFVESFVGKNAAWHQLGTVKGRAFTKEDVKHDAPEILSPISLQPVYVELDFGDDWPLEYTQVPSIGAAVREYDSKIVGAGMGIDTYGLVQPEEAWDWGEAIANLSGFPCISAGTIRNGGQAFFTFDTGDVDSALGTIKGYLSVLNSYDMTWQLQALNSNIIVVCANTAAMAQASAYDRIVLRHTSGIKDRMAQALAAIKANVEHTKATVEIINTLGSIQLRDWSPLLDELLPPISDGGKRSITMRENAREQVAAYIKSDIADGVRGTGLAFVQGVNTYENWSTVIRGTKGRNEADVRAERQIDAMVKGDQPLTRRATDLVLAGA